MKILKDSEPPKLPTQEVERLNSYNIVISARKLVRFLGLVVLGLIIFSTLGQLSKYFLGHGSLYGLVRLFYLREEQNIPSIYSSFALLLCSVLLLVIALVKKQRAEHYVLHWKCLSIIFLYLSIDEAASIHELLIGPVRQTLNTSGIFYFAWVIPGAGFVFVLALAYLKFLKSLPAKTRFLFIMAGTMFLAGALGLEMIGGAYRELHGNENIIYAISVTIEESLEMFGILVFIYALVDYISSHLKSLIYIEFKHN